MFKRGADDMNSASSGSQADLLANIRKIVSEENNKQHTKIVNLFEKRFHAIESRQDHLESKSRNWNANWANSLAVEVALPPLSLLNFWRSRASAPGTDDSNKEPPEKTLPSSWKC